MEDRIDWVQIIEPKSKDMMYINLVTGECVWEAPTGAKIKPADENQWWQLFDTNTKRNYYYNSKSQRTIWQRPLNADIIPLAKLQMINEKTASKNEHTLIYSPVSTNNRESVICKTEKGISLQNLGLTLHKTKSHCKTTNLLHPYKMLSSLKSKNLTCSMNFDNINTKSSLYDNPLNLIYQPLKDKLTLHNNKNAYESHPLISNQEEDSTNQSISTNYSHNIHSKNPFTLYMTTNENISQHTNILNNHQQSTNISRHISSPSLEYCPHNNNNKSQLINYFHSTLENNAKRRKQPRTNPNYVNIKVKTNDGSLRNTYIRINDKQRYPIASISSSSVDSLSEYDSNIFTSLDYLNEMRNYFSSDETISTDKTRNDRPVNNRIIKNKSILKTTDQTKYINNSIEHDKVNLLMKRFTKCTDEFNIHSARTTSNNSKFKKIQEISNEHLNINSKNYNKSTLLSPILPIHHDSQSNSPSITSNSMGQFHNSNIIDSSLSLNRSSSTHFRSDFTEEQSNGLSSKKISLAITEFEPDAVLFDFLNLNLSKRRFFGKRLTSDNLLSWSKEGLGKSLLRTTDKIHKREASELFKLIQVYMGDRKSRKMSSLHTCLELTTKGWSLPSIRDEIYLQLIKQTTANPNVESLQHGWELIAICLSFFPPSIKFQQLLERYISMKIHTDSDISDIPIPVYAKVCQKRLEKILLTGPKRGLKKPTYEEIELSKHTIHFPSMFGASLEEVMAMQRTRYPERRLPWIQTTLSEEVLRLNGVQTEGIFRVPGDLDSVNALKVKCDRWQFPPLDDAHLPASLLKLWYRELAEPLIPSAFYDQCILNCDKTESCIRIVNSLPDINRLVLSYLIHFLQIFAASKNVAVTKMDVNNLSMIFAPNILRCTSDDAKTIFENARKEMLFIKVLILNLNTDLIEGVI